MKTFIRSLINYRYSVPVFAVLVLFLHSCSIDENINNSPNAANEDRIKTSEGISALMVGLQVAVADFYSGDRSRISSIWSNQMVAPPGLGRPQAEEWNNYNQNQDGPNQDMWILGYRGVKLANDIIEFSPQVFTGENAGINNSMLGMAKAYKALIFGELAAYFGSIPINVNGLEPAPFVSQTEAYAEAQRLLDEALGHFANAGATDADLNFSGDGPTWIRIVHSLKARYYLHMKQYDQALIHSADQSGINDPSQNLYAIYTETPGEYSPWGHWTLTEPGEPIRVEATFMRELKNDTAADNRISEYFAPNDSGQYWGYAGRGEANPDPNELDPQMTAHMLKYAGYGVPFPLITYQETVLIRAEANARAGNTASAVADLDIIRNAAGLGGFANAGDNQAVTSEILRQKWLALFLEGQAYTDMRRTNTLPNPNVPKRFIYPEAERNANPHVPADDDALVEALTRQ